MITIDDMLTSSGKFPDRPKRWPPGDELLENATITASRVNMLLILFGESRGLSSGYRPPAINKATKGAATKSTHMTCKAADIEDPDGKLDRWITDEVLEHCDLYREHPNHTDGWCHVQTSPPKSGKRTYIP